MPAEPCPQMAHGVIGREDCLVANVFTAGIPNSPVIPNTRWFDECGAGSSRRRDPGKTRKCCHSIDPVPPRGPGFWAANASAPQTLAWTTSSSRYDGQETTRELGGDPKRVMVFGVSAGGAAVAHLLTTAPPGLIFAAAGSSGGHRLDGAWEPADDDFVAPSVLAAASAATAAAVGCAVDDVICFARCRPGHLAAEGVRFAPALLSPTGQPAEHGRRRNAPRVAPFGSLAAAR